MHTVSKIMSTGIKSLKLDDSLQDARNLMKSHSIRHIPIVDRDNNFVGLLSQRTILADAFHQLREGEHDARVNHTPPSAASWSPMCMWPTRVCPWWRLENPFCVKNTLAYLWLRMDL